MNSDFQRSLASIIGSYGVSSDGCREMALCISKAVDAYIRGDVSRNEVLETLEDELRYYIDPSTFTENKKEKDELRKDILDFLKDQLGW